MIMNSEGLIVLKIIGKMVHYNSESSFPLLYFTLYPSFLFRYKCFSNPIKSLMCNDFKIRNDIIFLSCTLLRD